MNNFKYQEICRYVLVGCSGVICDYLLYSGLLYFGWQLNYAKMTSFCIGAGYVFVVQKYWTFRNSGRAMKQLPKYILLYGTTAVMNTVVNSMAISLGCPQWLSFLLATGASTVGNFIGQKFYVFR